MLSKHITIFRNDLRYWQRQGLAQEALLRLARLPNEVLQDDAQRLGVDVTYQLFEAAEQQLDDPAMGIRIGQQILLPDIAPLGDVLHYYRDGWQAMKALETYWALLSEAQQVSIHHQGKHIAVRFTSVSTVPIHRMQVHSVLSGFLRLADVIFGLLSSREAYLELNEATPHSELFSSLLGVPVTGGCHHDQVCFPAWILDIANPNHDDAHFQSALTQCDRALHELQDYHFIDQIRERLRHQLQAGCYDQQTLAQSFNMSVRNLQRRLSAHQTRFRDLLDQVRAELAEQMVRYSQLGFAEIASQLGYEDPSSFHKAFKRWLGIPPGEYRHHCRLETS